MMTLSTHWWTLIINLRACVHQVLLAGPQCVSGSGPYRVFSFPSLPLEQQFVIYRNMRLTGEKWTGELLCVRHDISRHGFQSGKKEVSLCDASLMQWTRCRAEPNPSRRGKPGTEFLAPLSPVAEIILWQLKELGRKRERKKGKLPSGIQRGHLSLFFLSRTRSGSWTVTDETRLLML